MTMNVTMKYCQFLLLAEGSTDLGLQKPLEDLLIEAGFDSVFPVGAYAMHGTVATKLEWAIQTDISADIIFVHRDADNRPRSDRVDEVARAAESVEWHDDPRPLVIPVVPVTMTEAWLLLDETAIRLVCGASTSGEALNLPKTSEIERRRDPKAILKKAFQDISPRRRGRRLPEEDFAAWRGRLLERLDIHGPVTQLSAWQALEADVRHAHTSLAHSHP